MRVLIIGSGGREHALGWKIAQSPLLAKLFFAPGNPGTEELGTNITLAGQDEILAFAQKETIDLVVVGPEQPLVDGLADRLNAADVPCFGPCAGAARLEGSKAFSKEIMDKTGIPTAAYASFTDYEAACSFARGHEHPLVVKADGLAAGKGVTICFSQKETEQALDEAMRQNRFGEAGRTVVIEEFLQGVEASVHFITDGEQHFPLISAKDHKAISDGDVGPNTGGMGTYAPNPLLSKELLDAVETKVCEPILRYLAQHGTPFRGVLFAGLMLTESGPKVLEFNVRFGDPETQVVVPMMDFDLLPVLHGAATGNLPSGPFPNKEGSAVCIILAAEGYPGSARKGDRITGIRAMPNSQVFHAGIRRDGEDLVTNGGRVLGVTAWAEDLRTARHNAYTLTNGIQFQGKQNRTDIGANHE